MNATVIGSKNATTLEGKKGKGVRETEDKDGDFVEHSESEE